MRQNLSDTSCFTYLDNFIESFNNKAVNSKVVQEIENRVVMNLMNRNITEMALDKHHRIIGLCECEDVSSSNYVMVENYPDRKRQIALHSKVVQQRFADLLGDRDYDSYEFDEHKYLKDNIGYAIFGPPNHVNGFSDDVKKEIKKLYKKILKKNSKFFLLCHGNSFFLLEKLRS